jgi:hypothetical protein
LWLQANPGKKVCQIPSQKKKLDVVALTCHPSDGRKHKTGESWSREDLVKSEMLFSNYPEQNG